MVSAQSRDRQLRGSKRAGHRTIFGNVSTVATQDVTASGDVLMRDMVASFAKTDLVTDPNGGAAKALPVLWVVMAWRRERPRVGDWRTHAPARGDESDHE
jgi:hypothetical protein